MVSAQSACALLPVTVGVCGRSYQWSAAEGSACVLRCPVSAAGVQTNASMYGSYGPSNNPNFRVCGHYGDTYGSCEVESNQIWFFRGGPDGPNLQETLPLVFTAYRSALQVPFCTVGGMGSASCASCSSSVVVQFMFEDDQGEDVVSNVSNLITSSTGTAVPLSPQSEAQNVTSTNNNSNNNLVPVSDQPTLAPTAIIPTTTSIPSPSIADAGGNVVVAVPVSGVASATRRGVLLILTIAAVYTTLNM
jgi:hypothetical protein